MVIEFRIRVSEPSVFVNTASYLSNSLRTLIISPNIFFNPDDIPFDLPVFYDPDGAFERANPQLPANPLFHTFLLDRDNRVVLVGSPIGNPKMWELCKSTIDRLIENGGILPKRDTYDTDCKYVCRNMIVKSFGQQKYHY